MTLDHSSPPFPLFNTFSPSQQTAATELFADPETLKAWSIPPVEFGVGIPVIFRWDNAQRIFVQSPPFEELDENPIIDPMWRCGNVPYDFCGLSEDGKDGSHARVVAG